MRANLHQNNDTISEEAELRDSYLSRSPEMF